MIRGILQFFKTIPPRTMMPWNQREEFFNFTRGRFISDENYQMAQRHVKFNMDELCSAAATAIGSARCINVDKCADGQYNKAFVLTMDDGKQVIAKVPNPNAGRPHFATASEVATVDFVRNELKVPVPQVFAWSSRAGNPIGAEYIIMEKAKGVQLDQVWPKLDWDKRAEVLLQVTRTLQKLSSISFPQIGSLYYANDVPEVGTESTLYVDQESGDPVKSDRFVVGPINGCHWTNLGRRALHLDRGPWSSLLDYRKAMAHKEATAIREARSIPTPSVMLCGPGLYQPTAEKKLKALESFSEVLPYILPDVEAVAQSYLWHDDLHGENVFLDPENPSTISSIIDWQNTYITPLFDHNITPGPFYRNRFNLRETEEPDFPADFDSMSDDEKRTISRQIMNHQAGASLRKVWRVHLKPVSQTLEFEDSTAWMILLLASRLFENGETHIMAVILALRDEWPDLPCVKERGSPAFPLTISDAEAAEMENDLAMAMASEKAMSKITAYLSKSFPGAEQGCWVHHEEYIDIKNELRELKKETVEYFAKTAEDRAAWDEAWPFDD